MGGETIDTVPAMPPSSGYRILSLEKLHTDWSAMSRSPDAVRVLHLLADRDAVFNRLVRGADENDPLCPTPWDLVAHMHGRSSRGGREEAAALVRLMLRESSADPLIIRFLVQALLPGLLSVAAKLQWGNGGDWSDGDEFFTDLLSTTWIVVDEWSGQDRPYAVLDLLSAIRCRLRRQLFRTKDTRRQEVPLHVEHTSRQVANSETELEQLARDFIDLRHQGMRTDEIEVLYAQHVLGFSIAELAHVTGRNRRTLYARRDRGHRRLSA